MKFWVSSSHRYHPQAWRCVVQTSMIRQTIPPRYSARFQRNVQRFRGGLVFKGHGLFSLNSRLESNKERESECQVSGFGFQVSDSGGRVPGFGFRVSGFGFKFSGFGVPVSGVAVRVPGFGFRVSGVRTPHASKTAPELATPSHPTQLLPFPPHT